MIVTTRTPEAIDVRCPKCEAQPGYKCVSNSGWPARATHAARSEAWREFWRKLFDSTQIEPVCSTSNGTWIGRQRDYSASVKAKEGRMGGRYWIYRAVNVNGRSAEILIADKTLDSRGIDVEKEATLRLCEELRDK